MGTPKKGTPNFGKLPYVYKSSWSKARDSQTLKSEKKQTVAFRLRGLFNESNACKINKIFHPGNCGVSMADFQSRSDVNRETLAEMLF